MKKKELQKQKITDIKHYSSFFQSVCVIGYCLFPLVVVATVAIFVETVWFRVPGSLIAFGWSTFASVGFLSESKAHLSNRRALAVSDILFTNVYIFNPKTYYLHL